MIKRIIYRPKKPLFEFKKKESTFYGPRVKSAPPIEINFASPIKIEPKPVVKFVKADGTPITSNDLEDSSDNESSSSSESESSSGASSSTEALESLEKSSIQSLGNMNISLENPSVVSSIESLEKSSVGNEFPIDSSGDVSNGRALMLSNLLKKFGDLNIAPVSREFCYSVDEMLSVRERTIIPLDLKIKKKSDGKGMYKVDRSRGDTCIEQTRLEFNRLTAKNLNLVIKNLKNVKVGTIEEMKEISNILFDKAVCEPMFVKHYALLILDLKKEWQSEEERNKDINQTVFFGTLLTLTLKTLEEREKWGDEYEKSKEMTFEERMEYESKLEEAETERYIKKRRTLGTIDFLSALYSLNVISYVHMNACIEALMRFDDQESLEVLCYLIEHIGEKLVVSGKEHVISMICSHLMNNKDKYSNRIRYMIEGLMERRSGWKGKENENKAENLFSCLEVENEEIGKDEFEGGEEILPFLSSLFGELSMAYEDEDKQVLSDNFTVGESRFGVMGFYSTYFLEAISNHKVSDTFIDFFISFRRIAKISKNELREVLQSLRDGLDELMIDFPISPRKYAELITRLRVSDVISSSILDELKTPDYETRITDLISRWYKSDESEKALLLFPREKIEDLMKN